jgi:hypothetical protein
VTYGLFVAAFRRADSWTWPRLFAPSAEVFCFTFGLCRSIIKFPLKVPQWKRYQGLGHALWPRFCFIRPSSPAGIQTLPVQAKRPTSQRIPLRQRRRSSLIDKLFEFVWVRSRKACSESTENFLSIEHHVSFLSCKRSIRVLKTHKRYRDPVVLSSLCLAFTRASFASAKPC